LVAVFLADEGSIDLAGAFTVGEAGSFPAGLRAILIRNVVVSESKGEIHKATHEAQKQR
jgi:hypothetical protein